MTARWPLRRELLPVWTHMMNATQAGALICVRRFEYAGCQFVRGRSRVPALHPAARACPGAFAQPNSGRLSMRIQKGFVDKLRACQRRCLGAEEALLRDLEEALEAEGLEGAGS